MNNQVIAFIGAGNMAHSLIGGLIADGYPSKNIWASNPTFAKLQSLKTDYGINVTDDNHQAVAAADIVVLAVKPHSIQAVCESIASLTSEQLILSVAAGILESDMQHWLGGKRAVVRAMPNTPALIGNGASGLYANQFTSSTQRNNAESIMRAVGVIVWVDEEKQLDIVTALSGSGPAYYFLFMEAFEAAAVTMGLPVNSAHLLTVETALGAARMALKANVDCAQLRRNVVSPGGTTERALEVLEQGGIRSLLDNALQAAHDRAVEIAIEHGRSKNQ